MERYCQMRYRGPGQRLPPAEIGVRANPVGALMGRLRVYTAPECHPMPANWCGHRLRVVNRGWAGVDDQVISGDGVVDGDGAGEVGSGMHQRGPDHLEGGPASRKAGGASSRRRL